MILKTVLKDTKFTERFSLLALLVLVSGVLFPVQGIKYITITQWAKNGKNSAINNESIFFVAILYETFRSPDYKTFF